MIEQREKLIELLNNVPADFAGNIGVGAIADYLLANRVIVPTCKIGQKVWFICRNLETYEWYICQKEIIQITQFNNGLLYYVSPICFFVEMEIGKRLFLSREDAEKALKAVE